jgi:23S rRNA-/tRNA-specific pseudouridylate synthase
VVDKAAGLLSMGSEGEKERTAHRILNEHLKALTSSPAQQAFIVHRLDRETSGLMMFARSRAVQAALQQNWKSVTKKYLAVVEGVPAKPEGTLRDNLEESKSLRMQGSPQLFDRADARNRPQKPDSRTDVRLRSSDRRRSQIRRDYKSRATPSATFI